MEKIRTVVLAHLPGWGLSRRIRTVVLARLPGWGLSRRIWTVRILQTVVLACFGTEHQDLDSGSGPSSRLGTEQEDPDSLPGWGLSRRIRIVSLKFMS